MPDPIVSSSRAPYAAVITPVRAGRPVPADDAPRAHGPWWRNPLWLGLVAAMIATFAVHVAANALSPYGLHRDELLYLAMGRHLALFRMDFPPAIAIVAELSRALLGDSIVAIRVASALAASVLVGLAFGAARLLGGRLRACALAALAVLATPLFLRAGSLFQPVVFDQLWWTLGLVALVRLGTLADAPRRRLAFPYERQRVPPEATPWLALGVACGLGLLTKFSIAFFGVAVLVGVLATPSLRRALRGPWPWLAAAVALLIGSPSLIGQVRLGWPVFGQLADLRSSQLGHVGPVGFVAGQLLLGPSVALAALGAWWLLRAPEARAWRAVGWTCVAAFALLLLSSGKAYYVGPIYPMLFAAGAVAFERRLQRIGRLPRRRLARVAAFAALALYGLLSLPFGLPIVPPDAMARYAAAFGGVGTTTNTGGRLALPQDYADMLGWPEEAARVDAVLDSLPEAQRREAVLVAGNYGEAGALEYYGPRLGLPSVVSPAGSYWFFGPGDLPGATVVTIGIPVNELRRFFRRVTPVARVDHRYAPWIVAEERDAVITVAEDPIQSLQDVWPSLRPR